MTSIIGGKQLFATRDCRHFVQLAAHDRVVKAQNRDAESGWVQMKQTIESYYN